MFFSPKIFLTYFFDIWYVNEIIHNFSVLIILTGNEFLSVGKNCWQQNWTFFILGKISYVESSFCDQMRKIVSFKSFFKIRLTWNFLFRFPFNFFFFFNFFAVHCFLFYILNLLFQWFLKKQFDILSYSIIKFLSFKIDRKKESKQSKKRRCLSISCVEDWLLCATT